MKKILITVTLFYSILYFTQVGINTANPQGMLHVDGAKDNPIIGVPTSSQQANDFVITSSGNIGIGVNFPNSKVEISSGVSGVSGLKFNDLNSSNSAMQSSKSLSVDANGNVVLSVPVAKGSDLGLFSGEGIGYTSTFTSIYPNYITTTFSAESADTSNSFNPSTGVYTVPSAGYFFFQGVLSFDNTTGGLSAFNDTGVRLVKNGFGFSQQFTSSGGNARLATVSVSGVILCAIGDQITLSHTASGNGFQYKIAGRSLLGWKVSNP